MKTEIFNSRSNAGQLPTTSHAGLTTNCVTCVDLAVHDVINQRKRRNVAIVTGRKDRENRGKQRVDDRRLSINLNTAFRVFPGGNRVLTDTAWQACLVTLSQKREIDAVVVKLSLIHI